MKWTPDLTQRMLHLHSAGFSLPAVAAQMHISLFQVESKCHRLGVTGADPGKPNEELREKRRLNRRGRECRPQHDLSWVDRMCLWCRETFKSEWVGNRICRQCKGREAWRSS